MAVPLKKVVRHASFERSVSENLVVRVELSDGYVGYGEGVPRSYVTGETVESAFGCCHRTTGRAQIGQPGDFAEVVERLETLTLPEIEADPRGMAGNAARCALELAILEPTAAGSASRWGGPSSWRRSKGSRRLATPQPVRYSGAITAESTLRRVALGLEDADLRLPPGEDQGRHPGAGRSAAAERTAEDPRPADGHPARRQRGVAGVRAGRARRAACGGFGPTALEQPVPHAEVDCPGRAAPAAGHPGDARRVALRLSRRRGGRGTQGRPTSSTSGCRSAAGSCRRCGSSPWPSGRGWACSSAAIPARRRCSRPRGGTSPAGWPACGTSRARTTATSSRANLTRQDLTFGYGGWARPLDGPGLGVEVDPAALEAMTVQSREIRYD